MSAHPSRIRLFQRNLRSLVWVWVWVWDWIHSHTPPRTRSPSSRPPPFTHYPFPPRSLVCGGQPSPHKPRLVVSHSTCPPLSSSPHAHSFVIGPAVINTHTDWNTGELGEREILREIYIVHAHQRHPHTPRPQKHKVTELHVGTKLSHPTMRLFVERSGSASRLHPLASP